MNYLMWTNTTGNPSTILTKAISTKTTANDFVAEFNLKLWSADGADANSTFGVFVSQQSAGDNEENKILYVALDIQGKKLKTFISDNNNLTDNAENIDLGNTDFSKWHTIRIKKVGTTVEIYYDNMLKITKTGVNLGGGHLGYISAKANANFGWVGFSNF